jgi:hypothetical protein
LVKEGNGREGKGREEIRGEWWCGTKVQEGESCPITAGTRSHVHLALLDAPDPEGKQAIQAGVSGDSRGGVVFCVVEAELEVPIESRGADGKGQIADAESHIGENVRLLEFERVEVVGDGIVAGIFEV